MQSTGYHAVSVEALLENKQNETMRQFFLIFTEKNVKGTQLKEAWSGNKVLSNKIYRTEILHKMLGRQQPFSFT